MFRVFQDNNILVTTTESTTASRGNTTDAATKATPTKYTVELLWYSNNSHVHSYGFSDVNPILLLVCCASTSKSSSSYYYYYYSNNINTIPPPPIIIIL